MAHGSTSKLNWPSLAELRDVIPLARSRGLSSYDAAYLKLAMCKGARLATPDEKLRKAAKAAGAEVFAVPGS